MNNTQFEQEAEGMYPGIDKMSKPERYLNEIKREVHITARQMGQKELEEAKAEVERLKGLIRDFRNQIGKVRNGLYENTPTGEVSAFDLLKVVKSHLKILDSITAQITYNP